MRLVKSLALVTVLVAAGAAGAATAVPPGLMYQKTYYSDATHTSIVGLRTDRCVNGNVGSGGPGWGVTSAYVSIEAVGDCPGGYW